MTELNATRPVRLVEKGNEVEVWYWVSLGSIARTCKGKPAHKHLSSLKILDTQNAFLTMLLHLLDKRDQKTEKDLQPTGGNLPRYIQLSVEKTCTIRTQFKGEQDWMTAGSPARSPTLTKISLLKYFLCPILAPDLHCHYHVPFELGQITPWAKKYQQHTVNTSTPHQPSKKIPNTMKVKHAEKISRFHTMNIHRS